MFSVRSFFLFDVALVGFYFKGIIRRMRWLGKNILAAVDDLLNRHVRWDSKCQITLNSKQSGQVRLSLEGCLAVLFNLGNGEPYWIHKSMIKYDMTY